LNGCSTFPITIENLRKTLTISKVVGLNVRVNHTLFPANYHNAEVMIRFVADLGVKMIRIHYAFPFPKFESFDSTQPVRNQGDSLCFISPSKWLAFQHCCTELSEQLGVEIVIPRVYGKDEVKHAEARKPSYLIVEPDGNLIICSTHGMVFQKERRNFATVVSDRSVLLNPHSLLFDSGNSKCCKAIPHLVSQLPDKIRLRIEETGGIGCIYVKSPLAD
jgi:sulfatase maturation enzyme AslB (radical SAM superfamily)